jgi:hypothetical protein
MIVNCSEERETHSFNLGLLEAPFAVIADWIYLPEVPMGSLELTGLPLFFCNMDTSFSEDIGRNIMRCRSPASH